MNIDLTFGGRLRVPLIAAPMFLVSNPELALAVCAHGIMGSFPAHSVRTRAEFGNWLTKMEQGISNLENPAPWAVNLVVHPSNNRMEGDLALCIQHKVPVILTSKGAPNDVFLKVHDYGGVVFHDVASARHAEKALEAGADGLIAVCSGAGGHTGTINPFALVGEIRKLTDRPVVLAGGMSTGSDILAAQVMGADLAYMGTRFIAAKETLASDDYRDLLVESTSKDVFFSAALDGAPANWMRQSLINAGIDLDELATTKPGKIVAADTLHAKHSSIHYCGHGVGAVKTVESAATICQRLISEYEDARTGLVKFG